MLVVVRWTPSRRMPVCAGARARMWRPKGSAFASACLGQLAACKTLAQLSLYAPGRSGRRRIGAEKRRRGLVREPTKKPLALVAGTSAKFAEAVNSYVGTRRDGDGRARHVSRLPQQ